MNLRNRFDSSLQKAGRSYHLDIVRKYEGPNVGTSDVPISDEQARDFGRDALIDGAKHIAGRLAITLAATGSLIFLVQHTGPQEQAQPTPHHAHPHQTHK